MTEAQKKAIAELVAKASEAGGQSKLARTLNISPATVSNIVKGKWSGIADKMWNSIAAKLRFTGGEWVVAQTANYKILTEACHIAQQEGMSIAVSYDAGHGKTCALQAYAANNSNAYYLQCAEYWSKRLFLQNMYRALGCDPGMMTTAELSDSILAVLRKQHQPLVILDEVDKLRDVLLMFYIELYNKLNGVCGFLMAGAPALAIAWERNAKRDKRGFKEIYSRIGRRFLELRPITLKDVQLICRSNGVTDEQDINAIWNSIEGEPDLRRVEREVKKVLRTTRPAKAA